MDIATTAHFDFTTAQIVINSTLKYALLIFMIIATYNSF